jgi:polynucleotide 5'-hydroxyl-kinase GRC3/NOL9
MLEPFPTEHLDWDRAVELLAAQTGTVALIGATDVGKTTLTLAAANTAVRAGRRVAVLDTDLGQSEIGPPGTLGVVRLEAPVATLGELKPRALAFVGAISPVGHLLSLVQGTRRLAAHARERGDEVVYVDTSGLVHGRLAEKLKLAKLAVLVPALVVLVERERELERLGGLIAGVTSAPIMRVRTPREIGKKSPAYRRMQRSNRLRRQFEGARGVELDAGSIRTFDTWLYSGTALTAAQLRGAAVALKTDVPHGELTADGVYLCATGRVERRGLVTVQEEFPRRRITVTPATSFNGLLVGLVGAGGHLVDVGLLQGVNFERAVLSVLTPARSLSDVVQIHFGRMRIRPDGSEIAHLRPSDL